jgi:hypothetical protein
MNWKLVTVILISLILLIACYLTLDLQIANVALFKKVQDHSKEPISSTTLYTKKIQIDLQEDNFKNLKIPEDHVAYYFPTECPDYKLGFYIVDKEYRENNKGDDLERYYIPEEKHLIIVKKDHIWTKEPNFTFWKNI